MIWLVLIWSQGAGWILLLGNAAWSLLRKPPRSPSQRVPLFGRLLLPVAGVILALILFGQQGGWLHDGAESTLKWTGTAFSICAVVWAFGEGRLMAFLAARAAAGQEQA